MATIDEITTTDVATLDPQSSLRDALEVLRGEEVSGAPVVAGGEVVGVVSVTDILEFQATQPSVPSTRPGQTEWGEMEPPDVWEEGAESPSAYFVDFWSDAGAEITARFEQTDGPEWDLLEEHVVGEVMTRRVVAVSPGSEIRDAARVMADADVHRVLVMDDTTLKGIVTATDVVRAVADGLV